MKGRFILKVRKAVSALLTKPAVCTPELRQSVEAFAERLSAADRETTHIPDDLVAYVTKVALHAYRVTDEDVQSLKDAGYSEDAIFEITLCASLGTSLARLERGLQALKGVCSATADS